MKIEVNITKTRFFIILGAILLLAVWVIGVYAYNADPTLGLGNPPVMGHSVDEIDWNGNITRPIYATTLCLNGDCRTSWSSTPSSPISVLPGTTCPGGMTAVAIICE